MVGLWSLLDVPAHAAEPSSEAAAAFVPPEPTAPIVTTWPPGVTAPAEQEPVVTVLTLVIDVTGAVEAVRVEAGEEPFVGPAVALAWSLRFRPATEGGVPVAVEVPLTLTFDPPAVNLRGTIRDRAGAPLAGATVAAGGQSRLTGADGSFAFRGIPAGETSLTIAAPGHPFPATPVSIGAGEVVTVDLQEPPADDGVVGQYRRERAEVVRRTLDAAELRATPGTMGDPLRAIANLPGASRTPLDAGWLLIRGGMPDNTGVYLDGVRVPLVYHLGGFTSVLHPSLIESVALYPGGQSARLGRATAGAVDVLTAPAPEALEAEVGLNLIHAGALVAVPWKGGGLTLAARRSYLDTVLDLLPGVTEEQASVAPRFVDAEAKLVAGPAEATALTFHDALDASDTSGNTLLVEVGSSRVHTRWQAEAGGRRVEIRPFYAQEERQLTVAALDLLATTRSLGGGLRAETPDDGTGSFGWSAGVDATLRTTRLEVNHVSREAVLASPEPYADVRLGAETNVVLGLRADSLLVSGQLPRGGLSPRAAVTLPVRDGLTLVADAGSYAEPPPESLLVGPPVGASLDLARAWGGSGGVRAELGPIAFEGSAWARRTWRITAYELDGSVGQGDALALGIESQTRYEWGRLHGWLTASWTRSLQREERGLPWSPTAYDQPLSFVLLGMYDAGKGWTLGGRFRWASGFPAPPFADAVAYDVLTGTEETLVGDAQGRLAPFHALDLKISRHVVGRRVTVDGYLDVQNVYNRRIPEPAISGFPELTSQYVYGYGLPVLPIFGIDVAVRRPTRDTPAPAAPPPAPSPPPP